MHSKTDRPGSLDACFAGIRDLLPAVDALISRHDTTKLSDYVDALEHRRASPLQSGEDFITEVANYTRETVGPDLGTAIAEDLRESPQVLTANHHGIDTFAQSTQSNLLFSLRKRSDGAAMKTIPVLACGSVPLNNLTYPRGLLIYACNDVAGKGGICKLPVFPDSYKRKLVSAAGPFSAEMLDRARARAKKLIADEKLPGPVGSALDIVFDDLARVGHAFPDYARQATAVNRRLWRRLFRGQVCRSELVYVEMESIACRLLERDLFDRSTICHQLLFDPELRGRLIAGLDGQRGCWLHEGLARRACEPASARGADSAIGTMFFWGVDAKGRQVPLHVAEGHNGTTPRLLGVDDSGNAWSIPLTPEEIARELRDRRLLPSIFTSYLLIAIARGVACIGGYYQADYLPAMQRAVGAALGNEPGEPAGTRGNGAASPDLYLSGMQAVGFRAGDRLLPAGPLEIIASGGIDDEQYARIGEVTVGQSHIASLFDFVMDVAPRGHYLHRVEHDISRLVHDSVGNRIVTISFDPTRQSG